MTHRVYKFEPGQCICHLGDPQAGAIRVHVRKLSGQEAVLDPCDALQEDRYVYATLKMNDGTAFSVRGLVVTSASGGILVQWIHDKPAHADRLDLLLEAYFGNQAKEQDGEEPQSGSAPRPDPVPATTAPVTPVGKGSGATSQREVAPAPAIAPMHAVAAELQPREPRPRSSAKPSRVPPDSPAVPPVGAAETPGEILSYPGATSEAARALEMEAKIRRRAPHVSAADLASRVRTVQVVNTTIIQALLKEAVDEAVSQFGDALEQAERNRLLSEAEASFTDRLVAYKAENASLEEKMNFLQQSLERAQGLLEEERKKVFSSNQFTVSDAGMMELEQRLGRLLDRTIRTGSASAQLEEELRGIFSSLLDDERDKIREQAEKAQSNAIALLEKKVQRLAASLEHAEEERDEARDHAQALQASGGMPLRNIVTAGLDARDPRRAKKLSLLKEIVEFNRCVRDQLRVEGRLLSGEDDAPHAGEASLPASGSQPDLDDTPWEPAAEGLEPRQATIRRPGG